MDVLCFFFFFKWIFEGENQETALQEFLKIEKPIRSTHEGYSLPPSPVR